MSRMTLRSFALPGALALSATVALGMGSRPKVDEEAVTARIQPLARVELASAQQGAATAGARSGEEIYKIVCGACHEAGVAGAPKFGDKAAWAPRIGVGLDVLVKTVKAGKNAMPPRGGSDATDDELARAVTFMANTAGANFTAPARGEKIASGERSGEQIAQSACLKCHETGEKGAPKLSDKAQWGQRGSKGLEALVKTVIRGHGNMPARGGVADLTDPEVKGAIAYLFKQVGAEVK